MMGEVGRRETHVYEFEIQRHISIKYLYFQRYVLLVLGKKTGDGRKRRKERDSHLLSTARVTSYKPFIYPAIYF